MTSGVWEIVGQNDRELPLGTTIGDALRRLVQRRFKTNAAKSLERRWGLDPKTAKNVVQCGNVSERTLTKAALSERWSLWMALGEEIFEETYADHLARVADERERAARQAAADEDQFRSLEARAAGVVSLLDGPVPAPARNVAGRSWSADDGSGAYEARQARLTNDDGGR